MTDVQAAAPGLQSPAAPYLLHPVRVARRQRLSTGYVRVTFAGDSLHRFADPGLDQRIKLILPAADGSLDGLPMADDWYTAWRALPDDRRPVVRTYTTRAVRPGEVDIDLVLHEPCGPAGRFAASCAPGDEVVLLGPNTASAGPTGGIDFRLPHAARRVLLAGDDTALPALARIIEALPHGLEGTVLAEVRHADDAILLPLHPTVDVRVLVRGDEAPGTLLLPAMHDVADRMLRGAQAAEPEDVDVDGGLLWEVPGDGAIPAADADCYAWLAGEAGVIKALRRMLVAEYGLDRRSVAFLGYWRTGRVEVD